jgi:bla regulator protein blaR1
MITYSLKTVFCSALLIVIYFLFLEKEKMHFFNRFYLLFAVLFSFIAPLIALKTKVPALLQIEPINAISLNFQSTASQQLTPIKQNGTLLSDFLLLVYLIVTAILFIRFLTNLYHICVKMRCSNTIDYTKSKIILSNEHSTPHSFLNYIFVPARDFKEGNIEEEILTHELAHVKQRHTLDIILIEIITVFAWINPFLFLYKRAIQLNHEFLADEFVTKSIRDIYSYQMLLLGKASKPIKITFTSPFNHLEIKKRIIMMNKKVSFKSQS